MENTLPPQHRPDSPPAQPGRLQVALFATCLADLFRPSVAFASIKLLEQAGCDVSVPLQQTCCGQPGYNSGDFAGAVSLAQQLISQFEFADYVVVPSGSCAGMICHHYPKLLDRELDGEMREHWHCRALALAAKTFELTSFLTEIAKIQPQGNAIGPLPSITYLDSCAGLRELNIKQQPRQLLQTLCNSQVTELAQGEVCCGFGGTFCAKMPAVSGKMTSDKVAAAVATGAQILTGGDLGCLMNVAGMASREGAEIEVRHIAELLAGDLDGPGIGEGRRK